MSIEQDLITYLKTDGTLMGLVGNGDSPLTCRIYPLILPQNWTAPACTYQRISSLRLYNFSGNADRAAPRFQIDIFGSSYTQVKSVADALRDALNGYSGTMGSSSIGAVTLENDIDGYSPDTHIWRIITDYTIWHLEN